MKSFDKTQDLRIALVHDYIKEYGGAERVLEALHEIWPDAPVFTTVYLPEFLGPHRERFKDWDIRTSFLQYLPLKEKLISPFRLIAPFVFKTFDFSQFDVVIVSATGAYSPNSIRCHPEQSEGSRDSSVTPQNDIRGPIHISYCHTPPRYLYGYATARDWKKNIIFRVLGEIANHFLRLVDYRSAQNVDYFIANSKNVAGRIKKFYRKDSTVIYPPVEISMSVIASGAKQSQYLKGIAASSRLVGTPRNDNEIKSKQYFLAGGRLARPKHIDLIVKTFENLSLSLKIFGRSFAGAGLKSKNSNIEFLGEVSDEEKLELMRNAKAYIFAAEDEDFGITPVEAMMCGTPVIAFASGGVLETVLQSRTGVFFNDLTIEGLAKAIKQFNNLSIHSSDCMTQAQKFSKERFKKEIREFVEKRVK